MGASFRHIGQILALAGCDLLTISPDLLAQLQQREEAVPRQLDPETSAQIKLQKLPCDEIAFRTQLNDDAMATEKLAEGIRLFCADAIKLELLLTEQNTSAATPAASVIS